MHDLGIEFECTIAGEGPERKRLELLVRGNRLPEHVTLLGHVAHSQLDPLYRNADLFVLTSLSEGIPVVLMEAMSRGTIVLAPAITGIPELITHGKSGFLYAPESLDDFVQQIVFLHAAMRRHHASTLEGLDRIRSAARLTVFENFSRQENLSRFAEAFLHLIAPHDWSPSHEDPLLQQI